MMVASSGLIKRPSALLPAVMEVSTAVEVTTASMEAEDLVVAVAVGAMVGSLSSQVSFAFPILY